jgi:PTH2 family peptidyl-tRNA hydrolase
MKQVIVVNTALKLPRGKLAAQVAHAPIAAFFEASTQAKQTWLAQGMPTIVLEGNAAAQTYRNAAARCGVIRL